MIRQLLVGLLCVLALGMSVQGAVFEENWDSGTIDAGTWLQVDPGDDIIVRDLGGGDYALALLGMLDGATGHGWDTGIYTQATHPRGGGGIYVQYKTWWGVNPHTALHGGWHHSQSGVVYGNDMFNSPEATIGYFTTSLTYYESGDGFQASGTAVVDPDFNTAFSAADSKENAVVVRITLGDAIGAKFEYSTDDGATWNLGRDTLGTGTSSNPDNYVGFGPGYGANGFQDGTAYIDDIVVDIIPEPMTMALLGLGGLALIRRRKA